jgi:hypothetical protein
VGQEFHARLAKADAKLAILIFLTCLAAALCELYVKEAFVLYVLIFVVLIWIYSPPDQISVALLSIHVENLPRETKIRLGLTQVFGCRYQSSLLLLPDFSPPQSPPFSESVF